MICNDTVCCWPITSNNIFIFDHNYSVKGGLKVFDCIVQNAKYWRPYGTCKYLEKVSVYVICTDKPFELRAELPEDSQVDLSFYKGCIYHQTLSRVRVKRKALSLRSCIAQFDPWSRDHVGRVPRSEI